MAAFAAALDCGADGLELDIHLSGDGVPVVLHDETLDRTTNGRGPVCWKTWRQLQQLDAGSWFSDEFAGEPVPALEEVLNTFAGQLRLNLELKDFAAGVAVLELLKLYPQADYVISSFHYPLLERLRASDPTLPLAVLFASGNWRQALAFARGLGAVAFHPQVEHLSRPMVAACAREGLAVHIWTVDDPAIARSLMRAGVRGCFTNNPRALRGHVPA